MFTALVAAAGVCLGLTQCKGSCEDTKSCGVYPALPYCDGIWRMRADGSACSYCPQRDEDDGVWYWQDDGAVWKVEPGREFFLPIEGDDDPDAPRSCGTVEDGCGEKCPETGPGGTGGGGGSSTTATGGNGGSSGSTSSSGGTSTTGSSGAAGEGGGGSGGSAGGSGGTGGSEPVPCDGACDAATPVCDETTDTCVECLDSTEHCEAPTPACDPEGHECVECVENGDCAAGLCDPAAHQCVECLETDDCEAPTPVCDTEQQVCAECLDNTHCTEPTASWCDDNSCAPCQTNADCAHLTGTTVCDVDAGQCVQCTIAEEAVCGGTSCNPATNTCTATDLGTVGSCEPCVADSECIGNADEEPIRRCVTMEFNGEPREKAYCLKLPSAGCERPYLVPVVAPSVSGAAEETYCGIDQERVTCEAVLDLFQSKGCPGGEDAECGCPRDLDGNCTTAGAGGLCRTVGLANNRCTYQCGNLDQCVTGLTCADQDPDFCQ